MSAAWLDLSEDFGHVSNHRALTPSGRASREDDGVADWRSPTGQRSMSRLKRRLPRASEVARFIGPTVRRDTADRWSRVRTVAHFEGLARGQTRRSVFDYVEGVGRACLGTCAVMMAKVAGGE
jgi:hypothetical protein